MSSKDLFREAAQKFINENPGSEGRKQAFEILTEVIYGPDEDATIKVLDNVKSKQSSNGGKEALPISTNTKSINSKHLKETSSAINIIEKEIDDMFDSFTSGTTSSTSNKLKRSTCSPSPLVPKKQRQKKNKSGSK